MRNAKTLLLGLVIAALLAGLAFAAPTDTATTRVVVGNTAPTVDSVTITPDDDNVTAGVQVNPVAGSTKTITVTTLVTDVNGVGDINTITAAFVGSIPGNGANVPLTCTNIDSDTKSCTGTYDLLSDDTAQDYEIRVTATDTSAASGTGNGTFTYTSLVGLEIDATQIDFGSASPGGSSPVPGDTSMATLNATTVRNTGNVQIDVQISGTNLAGSGTNTIAVSQISYDFGNSQNGALSTTPTTKDVNIAKGTNNKVDFGLAVPVGTTPDTYAGSVTITALAG